MVIIFGQNNWRMELPFVESGRVVGGIDLGQQQELYFGHIKFEMALQTSKWKGQRDRWVQVERSEGQRGKVIGI